MNLSLIHDRMLQHTGHIHSEHGEGVLDPDTQPVTDTQPASWKDPEIHLISSDQ